MLRHSTSIGCPRVQDSLASRSPRPGSALLHVPRSSRMRQTAVSRALSRGHGKRASLRSAPSQRRYATVPRVNTRCRATLGSAGGMIAAAAGCAIATVSAFTGGMPASAAFAGTACATLGSGSGFGSGFGSGSGSTGDSVAAEAAGATHPSFAFAFALGVERPAAAIASAAPALAHKHAMTISERSGKRSALASASRTMSARRTHAA